MRWRTAHNNARRKQPKRWRDRISWQSLETIALEYQRAPRPLWIEPLPTSAYKAVKAASDRVWNSSSTVPDGLSLVSIVHPRRGS